MVYGGSDKARVGVLGLGGTGRAAGGERWSFLRGLPMTCHVVNVADTLCARHGWHFVQERCKRPLVGTAWCHGPEGQRTRILMTPCGTVHT